MGFLFEIPLYPYYLHLLPLLLQVPLPLQVPHHGLLLPLLLLHLFHLGEEGFALVLLAPEFLDFRENIQPLLLRM